MKVYYLVALMAMVALADKVAISPATGTPFLVVPSSPISEDAGIRTTKSEVRALNFAKYQFVESFS